MSPNTPEPLSAFPKYGMKVASELARRYLPNAVRQYAAIAFAPNGEAPLHTKVQSSKGLVEIAGVIPQATPATRPPPLDEGGGDSGEPS